MREEVIFVTLLIITVALFGFIIHEASVTKCMACDSTNVEVESVLHSPVYKDCTSYHCKDCNAVFITTGPMKGTITVIK